MVTEDLIHTILFYISLWFIVINARHSEPTNSILTVLDGNLIEQFPLHLPWVRIEKLEGSHVSILLMAIQVMLKKFTMSFLLITRETNRLKYRTTWRVAALESDYHLSCILIKRKAFVAIATMFLWIISRHREIW